MYPFNFKVCLTMHDIAYKQEKKFLFEENNYYSICHDYLFKWIFSLKEFNYFTWMLLNILPAWEQMDSLYIVLKTKGIKIDNNTTFIHENTFKAIDQVVLYTPEERKKNICHKRWHYILQHT